jgi:Flp pilus assembly protein TadG
MASVPLRCATFLRDRRANALVEFAWLWPVLMLIMYGAYNLSIMASVSRQLSRLSDDMAQMIVTLQPSNSSSAKGTVWCAASGSVTCAALEDYNPWYAHDSAMVEFP